MQAQGRFYKTILGTADEGAQEDFIQIGLTSLIEVQLIVVARLVKRLADFELVDCNPAVVSRRLKEVHLGLRRLRLLGAVDIRLVDIALPHVRWPGLSQPTRECLCIVH